MKRKGLKVFITGMALVILTGCGKTDAVTEAVTEVSTEEVIVEQVSNAEITTEAASEEKTDSDIISEGSGNDTTEETTEDPADTLEGIAFNRKRKLPNIVEPLDDARGFNPRIVNADLFEVGEYWRKELGTEIYMILGYRNINEDPSEIELLDRRAESYVVKFDAILKFERHEDINIEICYYDDQAYIVNIKDDEDYNSYDNMPDDDYDDHGDDSVSDDSLYDQGLDD